jgi:hypothetical protein
MIVNDLYITGAINTPSETDTPLLIDADTVLSLSVSAQCLEPVTRQIHEIFQTGSAVENL